jgi:hypothetical protein
LLENQNETDSTETDHKSQSISKSNQKKKLSQKKHRTSSNKKKITPIQREGTKTKLTNMSHPLAMRPMTMSCLNSQDSDEDDTKAKKKN